MARAILEAQRNTRQVRLLLDARKPVLNHGIKFAFEDVCHTLKFNSIVLRFGVRRRLYRIDHTFASSFLTIDSPISWTVLATSDCQRPIFPYVGLQGCSKRVKLTSNRVF